MCTMNWPKWDKDRADTAAIVDSLTDRDIELFSKLNSVKGLKYDRDYVWNVVLIKVQNGIKTTPPPADPEFEKLCAEYRK